MGVCFTDTKIILKNNFIQKYEDEKLILGFFFFKKCLPHNLSILEKFTIINFFFLSDSLVAGAHTLYMQCPCQLS